MLKNNKATNNIIEAKPNAHIILFPVSETPLTEQKVEGLKDTSEKINQPVFPMVGLLCFKRVPWSWAKFRWRTLV